jgi:hypothetical protein
MSRRAVESVLSLVAAGWAAWLALESAALRGLELWVAAIALGATLLVCNLARAIGGGDATDPVLPPRRRRGPTRASDAVVIVPLEGMKQVTNFRDRRFHRYESGAEPAETENPLARNSARGDSRRPPELRGNWVMVSLFVGCDDRPWSESEIASRLDSLLHAGRWVAAEATRWRVPLSLGVCDTYFAVEEDSTEIGRAHV